MKHTAFCSVPCLSHSLSPQTEILNLPALVRSEVIMSPRYSLCQKLIGTHTFRLLNKETLGKSQAFYSAFPFLPKALIHCYILCVYKYLMNPLLR